MKGEYAISTSKNCREYIEANLPDSADALLSPSAMESLKAFAEGFAPMYCGFETRLAPASSRVDFGYGAEAWEALEMERWLCSPHLPAAFANSPEWGRIREWVKAWRGADEDLKQSIQVFGFEFDCGADLEFSPIPACFFYFRHLLQAANEEVQDRTRSRLCLHKAYCLLRGEEPSEALQSHWSACIDALPPHAGILGAGLFLAREKTPFRLTVSPFHVEEAIEYLERLGLEKEEERMAELVAITGDSALLGIGLDITSQGVARVGYIVMQAINAQPLLERLPIPEEQKAALREWRHSEQIPISAALPALQRANVFAPSLEIVRTRYVQHYKFGKNLQGDWEIKAYLVLRDTLSAKRKTQ